MEVKGTGPQSFTCTLLFTTGSKVGTAGKDQDKKNHNHDHLLLFPSSPPQTKTSSVIAHLSQTLQPSTRATAARCSDPWLAVFSSWLVWSSGLRSTLN
ncbi:hypothetical protein BDQ94DRAFT_36883 [Aspergillus welwitschiae]|uniref:Uncharacterized protein n=1 Tax=Aspergillus welwitschiae TaxID=1341132 RepID=A0A3F3Q1D5_9EURO|nr:hypothetical protein BDQ94DRAFT_36883 [Aspergillus welwitschiae]RDH33033.1 hypothetical protein BDQ94DRAFT_36883 [Aspergillus welwitschiae]